MMKDKALEELFLAARPTFDDGDAFIRKLEKHLDAVEYLKQHEEACIRRYRYAMLAAFVLGVVLGGGAIAMMLNAPADPATLHVRCRERTAASARTVLALRCGHILIGSCMPYDYKYCEHCCRFVEYARCQQGLLC